MMRRYAYIQVEELGARFLPSAVISPVTPELPAGISAGQRQDGGAVSSHNDLAPAQFGSETAFRQYLIDQAVQRYSAFFGQTVPDYPWLITGNIAFASVSDRALVTPEGDPLMETDGRYLYVLAHNQFVIFDTHRGTDLKVLSKSAVTGMCLAEYLTGDRLTVISQEFRLNDYRMDIMFSPRRGAMWPISVPSAVRITVFDVSDRGSPKVLQETEVDGAYNDSLAAGDKVYVAVSNSMALLGPEPIAQAGSKENELVYESEASYRARLRALPLDTLPHYTTNVHHGEKTGLLTEAANIYRPTHPYDANLMSLLAIDVGSRHQPTVEALSLITGGAGRLYASKNNLYLITTSWSEEHGTCTNIDKLSLRDGAIKLAATGQVPGNTLRQLSVNEDGRYLRIATTTDAGRGEASGNLYVLDQHGAALDIVGRLEGMAKSNYMTFLVVDFVGDRAFVSSRPGAPLLTIDLSDPAHPSLAGQLEIIGYHSYLHMIDATHLIGVGNEYGPLTGWSSDVQISLFDVSKLSHPASDSHYVFAPDGASWFRGQYDPHATSYSSGPGILTLPVTAYDAGWHHHYGQLVLHVDIGLEKLDFLGEIVSASPVKRDFLIGNTLYLMCWNGVIEAHRLSDLDGLVARVEPSANPQIPAPWGEDASDAESEADTQRGDQAHDAQRSTNHNVAARPASLVDLINAAAPVGGASHTPAFGQTTIPSSPGASAVNLAGVPSLTASMPTISLAGGGAGSGAAVEPEAGADAPQTLPSQEMPETSGDLVWRAWPGEPLSMISSFDEEHIDDRMDTCVATPREEPPSMMVSSEMVFIERPKNARLSPWLLAAACWLPLSFLTPSHRLRQVAAAELS